MRSRSGGAILKIFMAKGREPNMKRISLIRSLCACLCAGLLAGSCTAYAAGMQEQARTVRVPVPYAMERQDEGPSLYLSERAGLPAQAPGGGGARCAAANPARQRPLAAGIGRACV